MLHGFHGTTSEAAQAIRREGFQLSRNPYDWLGDGVYFFQDAPERAWEWAAEHYGDSAAVIGAEIHLVNCFDLLDTRWTRLLTDAYDSYLKFLKEAGRPIPRQTGGAHRLDREVINYAIGVLAERSINIACVRGAFTEGYPVFPDSAIYDRAHVQIAVRDVNLCIRRFWLESGSG
jgi:hypothetical protein